MLRIMLPELEGSVQGRAPQTVVKICEFSDWTPPGCFPQRAQRRQGWVKRLHPSPQGCRRPAGAQKAPRPRPSPGQGPGQISTGLRGGLASVGDHRM